MIYSNSLFFVLRNYDFPEPLLSVPSLLKNFPLPAVPNIERTLSLIIFVFEETNYTRKTSVSILLLKLKEINLFINEISENLV